jgi:hypothetical protein
MLTKYIFLGLACFGLASAKITHQITELAYKSNFIYTWLCVQDILIPHKQSTVVAQLRNAFTEGTVLCSAAALIFSDDNLTGLQNFCVFSSTEQKLAYFAEELGLNFDVAARSGSAYDAFRKVVLEIYSHLEHESAISAVTKAEFSIENSEHDFLRSETEYVRMLFASTWVPARLLNYHTFALLEMELSLANNKLLEVLDRHFQDFGQSDFIKYNFGRVACSKCVFDNDETGCAMLRRVAMYPNLISTVGGQQMSLSAHYMHILAIDIDRLKGSYELWQEFANSYILQVDNAVDCRVLKKAEVTVLDVPHTLHMTPLYIVLARRQERNGRNFAKIIKWLDVDSLSIVNANAKDLTLTDDSNALRVRFQTLQERIEWTEHIERSVRQAPVIQRRLTSRRT